MNILFYDKDFGPGGIAVVTETLASALQSRGYSATILVLSLPSDSLVQRLPKDIPLIVGKGIKYNKENVDLLRKILIEHKIDIVVNQQGLNPVPITILDKARKGLNVKVISVYHMQVNTNGRIISVQHKIDTCRFKFLLPFLNLEMRMVKWITAKAMRNVYNRSDLYEVLSPSFVPLFTEFTGIKNPKKLVVQTNPVTIQTPKYEIDTKIKKKEVLFVGRLDNMHKRPYRVVETWSFLENKYPDWGLTFVGDGPDREWLEDKVKSLGLRHVSFVGFQNPVTYYKRASILMLTSDMEGFPLVLAECMSYGVVPVVYACYPAVYDIIEDNVNGIIIPHKECFPAQETANRISSLIENKNKYFQMSLAAISKSQKYSLSMICKQWENNFCKITNGKEVDTRY